MTISTQILTFITDVMAADDYFDADFDSDLGDTDSNTSLDHDLGAGEAYLANYGDYNDRH